MLLEDVERILRLGQRCVLRALLATREIFAKSESKYLLNRLWIDDYCVWLQTPDVGACLEGLTREYAEARAMLGKSDFPKWKLNMIEKCFADMRIVAAAQAAEAGGGGVGEGEEYSSSESSSSPSSSSSSEEEDCEEDDNDCGSDVADPAQSASEEKQADSAEEPPNVSQEKKRVLIEEL